MPFSCLSAMHLGVFLASPNRARLPTKLDRDKAQRPGSRRWVCGEGFECALTARISRGCRPHRTPEALNAHSWPELSERAADKFFHDFVRAAVDPLHAGRGVHLGDRVLHDVAVA